MTKPKGKNVGNVSKTKVIPPSEPVKRGRGTPIKLYSPEVHDESIYNILADGGFYAHFCREHNLNQDTLYEWRKKYPSFKDALERGKQAGYAFWLHLPITNPTIDKSYWSTIMRNMYRLTNPIIPELTGDLNAEQIIKVATSYFARGKINNTTFDRLMNLANTKMKITIESKRDEALKLIANKIGIKIDLE